MMITSRELLDTSIAQLRTLAAFLGDQLGENSHGSESTEWETWACEEIMRSLGVLISRLQAHTPRLEGQGPIQRPPRRNDRSTG